MAALSRREYREVGKRRAKDAVLFVMKRLMEGPAYPRDLHKDFGFSRGTIRYHLNRLVKCELAKQLGLCVLSGCKPIKFLRFLCIIPPRAIRDSSR
jgi:hypothetical protein